MLSIENITVSYGKAIAIDNVSLMIGKGELVTLLGSNGAGKSTLLQTVSGLLKPRSGRITLDGLDLHTLPPHQIVRQGVIQVPEGREVFPDLSVMENLRMGAFIRKDSAVKQDMAFVFQLFPRLKERSKQAAGTLSGGEAQMLAIARGLIASPKILMLDEPSLGLAPVVRDDIFKVIKKIHRERGITILLVEQNAKMALSMSARGYILENGKIGLEGKGEDLINNDYVKKAYLGY
jgi:branched-chain amino acid transport system ATP-binding protein